jgi:hypothetical protein
LVKAYWDDVLCLTGSLKLGRVSAFHHESDRTGLSDAGAGKLTSHEDVGWQFKQQRASRKE